MFHPVNGGSRLTWVIECGKLEEALGLHVPPVRVPLHHSHHHLRPARGRSAAEQVGVDRHCAAGSGLRGCQQASQAPTNGCNSYSEGGCQSESPPFT